MVGYIEKLYRFIEEGHFNESSPEFIYYLSVPTAGVSVNLIQSNEMNTNIKEENIRYAAFISLTVNQAAQVGKWESYNEYKHQFEERDLFPYFECWYHLETRFGNSVEENISTSILQGVEAIKRCSDNFYVLYQFAEAVRIGIEEIDDWQVIRDGTSLEKRELLKRAVDEITHAIKLYPTKSSVPDDDEPPDNRSPYVSVSMCYSVLAQLRAFKSDFSAANEALVRARETYAEAWALMDAEKLRHISLKVDSLQIEHDVDDATSQIDEVQKDLEQTVNRFRSDIIQYIAFFAGVISIAVVSAQTSQAATSFQVAAKLILVFSGGLMVAFSAFGLLLPYRLDQDYLCRFLGLIVLGGLLIGTGVLL
ncbi:hypothetical protein SAMN05216278_1083 [Halopelagius longus]|uniref:Uncharacterized protein n=2 Tax=Halopelagius longus TaxID=1236180 RepID=A0A1H0Z8S6_9EURY|nr:hypothetical protein SAMN05216278_1083 [Halopelagius longus]